jgi:hypothetical protein
MDPGLRRDDGFIAGLTDLSPGYGFVAGMKGLLPG